MYLCKNGVGVEMGPIGQIGEYVFIIKNISELDSGSYSCVYSSKKYPVANVSASRQKTIHVKVTGKIWSGMITETQRSVREGEDLTLTCRITVTLTCAELYVYLCLNGIGKQVMSVSCSINSTSTTFLLSKVKHEHSGNYSCVYSTHNYSLSEVRKAGENTVFIQVQGPQWLINLIRLLCSVGVIIFACIIVIYDIRTS
ncbi:alpha-1B-glycoprotein-like [Astyanax mexicanus]|uniref:Alpha-1B-glycoprotein-like n=1 Tax=Astyanax mexicanus TaxID=7994 RepID=A0A8T2M4D1_ASTMX|nr:alpha-1B-glycoprotein-like [Astyanax mexicanus]